MIVQVYFNLHRKCWSVRDKQTRKVIAHMGKLCLKDCTLKVSEAGRQRVLASGHKNVHAYVEGQLMPVPETWTVIGELYYNPYKQSTFTMNGEPVYKEDAVLLTGKTAYLI